MEKLGVESFSLNNTDNVEKVYEKLSSYLEKKELSFDKLNKKYGFPNNNGKDYFLRSFFKDGQYGLNLVVKLKADVNYLLVTNVEVEFKNDPFNDIKSNVNFSNEDIESIVPVRIDYK